MTDEPSLPIRPVPVDLSAALLEGAAHTVRHLQWGLLGVLAGAMVLGASAGFFPQADGGELDHLARALLGPGLALPLPLALTAALLGIRVIAVHRRTVSSCADEFRPPAFQRHELAKSPASRLRTLCVVVGFICGFLTLLLMIAAFVIAEAWAWLPVLVVGALTAAGIGGHRALRARQERAAEQWNASRRRWPATGTRPRAVSLAHDDETAPGTGPLTGIAAFLILAMVGLFLWGLWQLDAGTLGLGDLPLTPLHLAGGIAPLAALIVAALVLLSYRHCSGQYRRFDRDPRTAAEARVAEGHARTAEVAAARELLRAHPARIPAIVGALFAGICLYAAPASLFFPMTGEEYEGTWAYLLWFAALPSLVFAAASWVLFSRAALQLPRHRLRILQQFPGLDPVIARVTREGENNTTVQRVVYGDRGGDPDLLRSDSSDDPR